MYRAEGKVTCREVQLHRDCEALCSTSRDNVVSCELRVAVLLPADPRYDISLPKVLPVLGKSYSRHLGQAETSECAELKMKSSFSMRTLASSALFKSEHCVEEHIVFLIYRFSGERSEIAKIAAVLAETEIPATRRSL